MQEIISVDPCHKFTWCLDACIREKNVDVKRSRELQGFLDSIKVQDWIELVFYNIVYCITREMYLRFHHVSERTRASVGGPKYDSV